MMEVEARELAALETLMNEFYASCTSNERKREIEYMLKNFTEVPTAWRSSLYYIMNSSNHYVLMYCLTQLEKLILKKWVGLSTEDRYEVIRSLYQLVLANHQHAPKFFRNKLVKLVVYIARIDWPHFYPDFFTNIFELINFPETTVLGLVFLQTASEELVCPWEDLSVARKNDLKKYFLHYIPEVFSVLTGLLDTFLQNQRRGGTATPPPSPTHGQPNTTSPVHSGSLFGTMLDGGVVSSSINSESNAVCAATLQALIHIFSWVPLDTDKVAPLVTNLFKVAHIVPCGTVEGDQCVGTLAITALTEIMYKIFMPTTCGDFLVNVVLQMMNLLERLAYASDLVKVHFRYMDKMTEFLLQFVKSHLHRVEDNPEVPVLQFLSHLYRYTFRQSSLERYYRCLDMWQMFISSIQMKREYLSRYSEVILALAAEVLKQSQFTQRQELLDELNDDTPDEDGHTELENFIIKSMDILIEVTHLMPIDIFNVMSQSWDENCRVYLRLHEKIEGVGGNRRLAVEGIEIVDLHFILRDLSSLTRLIGNMDLQFYGHNSLSELQAAEYVVRYVRSLGKYTTDNQFHRVHVPSPRLSADFIEIYVQILEALRPWCSWASQLHKDDDMFHGHVKAVGMDLATRTAYSSLANVTLMDIMDTILYSSTKVLLNVNQPPKLLLSAARLILHFVRVLRPECLWSSEPFSDFFKDFGIVISLPPEIQRLLLEAMYSSLVLPWRNVSGRQIEPMWEKRQEMLNKLVLVMTWNFHRKEFSEAVPLETVRQIVPKALNFVRDLISDNKNESVVTKRMISEAIQGHMEKAMNLLPLYVHLHDVCEAILDFFVALFEALQQQMGVTVIGNIVQNIFTIFTRKRVIAAFGDRSGGGDEDEEDGAESRAIEKFLTLLKLVMSEPSLAFNHFISSTTDFCLDHVYPITVAPPPGIKLGLFSVFHSILLNKWQYFYPCSLKRFGETESVKNQHQFVSILKAYGNSLLEPDINIFKHNLESLEQLNAKRNLYRKKLFYLTLWCNFLSALLNCLINKTHALLDEDIRLAIFNMASINFVAFHFTFLRRFLSSSEGLNDEQRHILQENCNMEKDAPSFIQNVQRLVNDLRCYRICNFSQPALNLGTSAV